jgi:hypothetical protein
LLPVSTTLSALMTMTLSPIVHMRGEGGFVLAAQTVCNNRGEAANDEICRVDDDPLLFHLCRLLREGFHGVLSSIQDPEPVRPARTFLVACVAADRPQRPLAATTSAPVPA